MKNQPLIRSEALKTFSREHHFGLLFTWKIKQGLKKKVETFRLLNYINYFWEGHLKEHFLNEETMLFNKIDAEACTQAKADHQIMTDQIAQLNIRDKNDPGAYLAFIEKLNEHIRYEERIVFPFLENHLSAVLDDLIRSLEQGPTERFTDAFTDEFWK